MFLRHPRRSQRAPSSEYDVQNIQPVDVPPTVPQMTQENHHSAYGVGAQARPRLYAGAIFYLLQCVSNSLHRTPRIPIHTLLLRLQRWDIHPAAD
jgi:hypothetical protein